MSENIAGGPGKRLVLIDELRGFALVCMLVYHFTVCLSLFETGFSSEDLPYCIFGYAARFLFIPIAGFSGRLSRRPYLRAVKILACAAAVWAATYFTKLVPPVTFGVLHLLGFCSLVFALSDRALSRIPPAAGLAVSAVLFILTYRVPEGYLLFWRLPPRLYASNWAFWLGFPYPGYTAADYFPVLPWIFLFGAGYFIRGFFGEFPRYMYRSRCRPLAFAGRHTLPIYLAHQPLFMGILWLVYDLLK